MFIQDILSNGCFALLAVILVIYLYFKYSYTYWARRGVPYLEPKFPLGNNEVVGMRSTSFGLEAMDWYNEIKRRGHKLGGAWNWANPVLVLTDPDYIRDVLVKDFPSFPDRDFFHDPVGDPQNENLFVVEKADWKNLRQKLTPMFTSARMKMMFNMVLKCSETMMECFGKAANDSSDIDIREYLASFTTDVVGCVVFGLEFGSFKSEDAAFRKQGKALFEPSLTQSFIMIICRISQRLARLLKVSSTPRDSTEFFAKVVEENVNYRRKNNIRLPDFTQLVMDLQEATKDSDKPFTFDDLVANVILFFVAGFETSSTTMHNALYELCRNPELQEKTRAEINSVLKKHDGQFTYEAYQEMVYLRQVIDESLRMYPPVQTLARKAVRPYTFENSNCTIEKDQTVVISTMGIARDPEHYPDPDRFDPDRFSIENKAARNPYVYLPFGDGPRNCIGLRFGLMQSSIGLVQILRNYRISISPTTKMPMTLKRGVFLMQTDHPVYLRAIKL